MLACGDLNPSSKASQAHDSAPPTSLQTWPRARLLRPMPRPALSAERDAPRRGDPLVLFNGRDGEFRRRSPRSTKKSAESKLGHLRRARMVADLWLCFAPLKKDATDFLDREGHRAGRRAFQPVFTGTPPQPGSISSAWDRTPSGPPSRPKG